MMFRAARTNRISRPGSNSTTGGGRTAAWTGAIDAFVGGATPTQLCLMLRRVESRRSTRCFARATVGTITRAVAMTSRPMRTARFRQSDDTFDSTRASRTLAPRQPHVQLPSALIRLAEPVTETDNRFDLARSVPQLLSKLPDR